MGIYIPWLVDAARTATAGTGKSVYVQPGWETRGHGGLRLVEVVVGHHTATPESSPGDYPSLNVVTYGRSDLPGPLANLGLGRGGHVYVIAAGLAYHAGASAYAGFVDLNDESIGIEAEDSGDGVWTQDQLFMYPRLVGALLQYMRRGVDRYASHRTVATPAGRKVDPAGIDDAWMRDRAAAFQRGEDMPLTNEDANKIWMFPCVGTDPVTGTSESWPAVSWLTRADYRSLHALDGVTALEKQVADLTAKVDELSQRVALSSEDVKAASKEGTSQALAEDTVKVHISIEGDTRV